MLKPGDFPDTGDPQRSIYNHCLMHQLSSCSNATDVAQWAIPGCSQPKPATDNGIRDGMDTTYSVSSDGECKCIDFSINGLSMENHPYHKRPEH